MTDKQKLLQEIEDIQLGIDAVEGSIKFNLARYDDIYSDEINKLENKQKEMIVKLRGLENERIL